MKVKNIMLCATAVVPSLAWAKELPNIIYIVTDQQTASAMSCMGNDDLHTPNMDKLAQAGVLFRNAYCSTPLSGPARAAMFTGYTSHEVGLARNGSFSGIFSCAARGAPRKSLMFFSVTVTRFTSLVASCIAALRQILPS